MSRSRTTVLAAAALLCLAARSYGQYVPQGKIVPAGVGVNSFVGASVALSADGNTMLVGAPNDGGGAGETFVYTRSGGQWTQQARLFGDSADGPAYQGSAVALSADGTTALVGGSKDHDGTGAIWVFAKTNGVWAQQGPKMWGTVLLGISKQGTSVALSADGNTALVGGPVYNDPQGAAWVFSRVNGQWDYYHPVILVGSGGVGAHQGTSVALSGDGRTAILGGPADSSGAGAAWVFTLSNGAWTEQAKLVGAGGFGSSAALSSDGSSAVIGASGDAGNAGAVWFYARAAGQWTPVTKLSGTDSSLGRLLGASATLSGDGSVAFAGGPGGLITAIARPDSIGATWMFTRSNGVWSQQGYEIVGTNPVGADALQGASVALSADGGTLAVGGPADNGAIGAVWVFVRPAAISPPTIVTQPANVNILSGQTATLTVAASGPGTLSYQWYQVGAGGNTAQGTNSASYTTPPLYASASYFVRVTNAYGSVDSNAATVSVPSATPAIASVANAASYSAAISPNTWMAVKGTNLAPAGDTRIWQTADFVNNQMPTQLDGVGVTVNGSRAYISYISPTQINFLAPPADLSGSVAVQVTNAGNLSAPFVVKAQAISPSFFTMGTTNYVAAEHANFSYLGPASLYPGITTPAKPGELVVLFGNGFGPVTTAITPGSVVQSGTLASSPAIQIGGITATTIQFAGLIGPGLYQFNVVVPQGVPDGDNSLTALYNGVTAQSGLLISVQH